MALFQAMIQSKNPREAAYLALLISLKDGKFIEKSLTKWDEKTTPASIDFNLAKEIAYGSARMALSLDYIAKQLASKKTLKLKLKERALLRTALYQAIFMNRIPLYAITDETLKIAKTYCHHRFVGYLNATLRQLEKGIPPLPTGETTEEMSIRYSYPPFFVQELVHDCGLERAKEIMEIENSPPIAMTRIRPQGKIRKGLKLIEDIPTPVATITDNKLLPDIASSKDYYIQNVTPAVLMATLAKKTPSPKHILDLCAAPGGKLLFAHDAFPEATLFANDISEKKLDRLLQNCKKYHLDAILSCLPGETFTNPDPFDLIILDVPCSNSGVLNKRPEARWRLSQDKLSELEKIQMDLIEHAKRLLSPNGEIWYLTCSILKQENEHLIKKACKRFHLQVREEKTLLPNPRGFDGGFASALRPHFS